MYKSTTLNIKGSFIGNQFTDGGTVVYPAVANFLNTNNAKFIWMDRPRDMGNSWEVDLLYEVNSTEGTTDAQVDIIDNEKHNTDPNQGIINEKKKDKKIKLDNLNNEESITATLGRVVVSGETAPSHTICIKVLDRNGMPLFDRFLEVDENGRFTYTLKQIKKDTSYRMQFFSNTLVDETGKHNLKDGATPDIEVIAIGNGMFNF